MKISIITVTLNRESTIRDAMMSVLKQDFRDFEHIIVDGCSSDGTMEVVRSLEPLYEGKLRYISEKDNGIYDAMNKGILMSTGDVIGMLNSDDILSSCDVLSTVAKEIGEFDAVYADVHYIADNNLNHGVRYYSSRHFSIWTMRLGFMPAHPTFYCRARIFRENELYDTSMKIASDFELMLRYLFLKKISTKYIRKNLVTMRIGGASTSGFVSHRQILKDHMHAYKKNHIYSNYFLEGLRYAYKIAELSYYRIRSLSDWSGTGGKRRLAPAEYIASWPEVRKLPRDPKASLEQDYPHRGKNRLCEKQSIKQHKNYCQ